MAELYFKVGSDWEEVVRLRNEIVKLKQELKSMDNTQSPAAFKTLNTQLAASTQQLEGLVSKAAQAGAEMENGFKKKIFDASQSVNVFTEKIIAQKAVVKDVEADVKRLGEAYRIVLKSNPLSANNKLSEYTSAKKALDEEKASLFDLTQQQANARLSVKKLRDEYSLYQNDGKQVVETNNGIAVSWKKALAVIGGVAALKAIGSEIIRVRGEFQSMQTAMETMVGKDVAGPLMVQVKELAKISPLTMTDMVGAEKMMLGFNIQAEDTIKYLKALSDISMGESGKFNSLTLAFSQISAAGKLMGQDLNQMINAGFNPLQQIAETTGKSIATLKDEMSKGAISAEMVQQAFVDAVSAGGKFYNMSENASKTINGQISMMQDALDNVFNELGTKGEDVIMSGIQATTSLIQNYETVGKVLVGLITTYGAYRTAVMFVTAAESKHTLVEIGLTNARILARKAQLALNAAMLTNPYVALATVIVGLGVAMWAMSDSTTAAARAQKEYNDIKDAASKKEQDHKQKIEELLTSARDESLATLTRQKSLEELRKEYPKIFEQYDLEKLKLEDILKLKQQINEEDSKRSVQGRKDDYTSLKQAVSNQQRYLQLFDNPELRKNMSDTDMQIWKMFAGKQSYVQIREQMEKNSELLKMYQKDVLEDNIAAYKVNLKNYSKEKLEAELKMAQSSASKRNGFNVGGMMVKGGDLESIISSINGALSEKKSPNTYKQDYDKAKKEWEDAKKALSEIEKDKDKFTSKQYEEAKKRKDTTEKSYKDLGGVTGSALSKQESAAEKLRKEQEKLKSLQEKQSKDNIRQVKDLEFETAQAKISSMQSGSEKTIAQMNLNHQKETETLKRNREDYLQKKIEAERAIFEADPSNKGQSFDSSTVSLSKDEKGMFNNLLESTISQQGDELANYYKEILSKYQGYTEKRLAAQKKFQQERDALVNAGASKETLAEHDYQRDETYKSIDNEFAMREDSFKAWADNIADLSLEKLRELLVQAERELERSEFLNPNDPKLAGQRTKVAKLKETLGGKEAETNTSPSKRSQKDWQDLYNTLSKVEREFDEIGKAVGGTAGEIISAAGSITASTLKMIDGIMLLADSSAWSMTATATAAQKAIKMVENASVILAIIGAALQIATKIANMFGADYSNYNKAKENYENYVEVLDTVISKQKELMETMTGKAAVEASQKALELIEKQADAARILGKERLNAGASAGSHSIGVRIRKGMSSEGWNEAKKALGSAFYNNGIGDGRMTGLFDLSVEQLEKLQMEAPTFWAKLDGDVREYLEQIIACNEKTEEMKDLLNEALTQVSFDDVYSNFLDALSDMDASSEDFADNFEKYMQKAILNSMLIDNYKSRIDEWYKAFAKANDDNSGITEEEYKDLQNDWNNLISDALSERDKLKDLFGWTSNESTSQSSTTKGFQAMSQDTGNELNGRFTALQITGEEIKNQNIIQSQSFNLLTMKVDDILRVNSEVRNIADDTRDLIASSYLELVQISENTGAIIKPIQQIQKDISEVKNNTKGLTSR